MIRISILAGLGLLGQIPLAAASAPSIRNVADAAAYGPRVAPGSLASIFGSNLASATSSSPATATEFPLPTSLGGATVTIGGTAVPLLYASSTQINFQVPASLNAGTASLVVQGPGGNSSAYTISVAPAAPAIFQYGANHVVAQNQDGATLNSTNAQAASGSVITVYLTGIGAVDNAVADGAATPDSPLSKATATATATIGAVSATVQFLGLTPGFAGLAQANIQVPSLPSGDYPLTLTVGGYVSASAAVSVSGSGTYTPLLTLAGSATFTNYSAGALSIELYNNVAYVCGSNHIVMVNVSDPTNPTVIGTFGDKTFNGNGVRCVINQQVSPAYLVEIINVPSSGTDTEAFAIYGLGNPQAPNLVSVATTSYGSMVDLSFAGNYAFATTSYTTFYTGSKAVIAQNGDLLAFDFTNPAQPVFLGILQPSGVPGSGNQHLKPYAAVVGQYYVYVSSSTATGSATNGTGVLNVISVATPSTPMAINQVPVYKASILMGFDVSGNLLLVAGNTAGQRNPGNPDFDFLGNLTLTAMDITNPQAPNPIATFTSNLQVNGTYNVFGFGNGIFAIVNNPPSTDTYGPSSLMLVDVRSPSNILLYPFQTQFGFAGILTTTNGFLLAPHALGLNIYQLQL